jgi:hypothetical protein
MSLIRKLSTMHFLFFITFFLLLPTHNPLFGASASVHSDNVYLEMTPVQIQNYLTEAIKSLKADSLFTFYNQQIEIQTGEGCSATACVSASFMLDGMKFSRELKIYATASPELPHEFSSSFNSLDQKNPFASQYDPISNALPGLPLLEEDHPFRNSFTWESVDPSLLKPLPTPNFEPYSDYQPIEIPLLLKPELIQDPFAKINEMQMQATMGALLFIDWQWKEAKRGREEAEITYKLYQDTLNAVGKNTSSLEEQKDTLKKQNQKLREQFSNLEKALRNQLLLSENTFDKFTSDLRESTLRKETILDALNKNFQSYNKAQEIIKLKLDVDLPSIYEPKFSSGRRPLTREEALKNVDIQIERLFKVREEIYTLDQIEMRTELAETQIRSAIMETLEKRIIELIKKLTPLIPSDLNEVIELVSKHGEYGIALENLCSIIEECHLAVHPMDLQEILALLKIMKFDEETILYYSKSIRTTQ